MLTKVQRNTGGSATILGAFADIGRSMGCLHLAWLLARKEVTSSIRLTALGPLWLIAQPLMWMLTVVIFYGPSLGRDDPIYPLYVATGITLYYGMIVFITDGARTFTSSSRIFLNIPLPISLCIFKTLSKSILQLLIAAPIPIITAIFYTPPLGTTLLYFVPGLLIYLLFGIGTIMTFGVIATRYSDFIFALGTVMRVMMFATPVFWNPANYQGMRLTLVHFNPLYHMLVITRDPLLGKVPPIESVMIAGGIALAAFLLGFGLFARYRNRIAVWM